MNAAELVQHYRAVHKRLWGTPPAAPARPQEAALVRAIEPPGQRAPHSMCRIQASLRAIATLPSPTMADVQLMVANVYCVPVEAMSQRRGKMELVVPRHIAMTICRFVLGESFPEICRQFGCHTHSSVLNAITAQTDAVSTAMEHVGVSVWTPPPLPPKPPAKTPWTPAVVADLRAMWPANVRCADIAAALGVSKRAAQQKAKRLGLKRPVMGRRLSISDWYKQQEA